MVLKRIALVVLLAVGLCACANTHGPWTDPSGNISSTGIIVEYDGLNRCGTQGVVFLEFAGRTYAKDLDGVLGPLEGGSGRLLSFTDQAVLPFDAQPTGYRHNIREVWIAESDLEDYLYLVYDDQIKERWPRAEIPCD